MAKRNENDLKLEKLSQAYFSIKQKISCQNTSLFPIFKLTTEYQKYISSFERAFNSLDDLEKTFIENNFFFQEDKRWWISIYSRSTYYRYKNLAVKHFLEVMYEK